MTFEYTWTKMDEDQTERLIELIHSRPALYDKRLKEYADRSVNKALWKEVCEGMIDSWNVMTPQEKILKAKEIQQRWQNLRTCFKRELNRSKLGQLSKKRRKYIYYNHLLFLLPSIEAADTPEQELRPRVSENKNKYRDGTNSSCHPQHTPSGRSKLSSKPSYERSILNMLKKKNEKEEIDEDKCFLLSLVPSFRKMNDAQKIDAKMEFLAVIKSITQSKSCSSVQTCEEIQNCKLNTPRTNSGYEDQEMVSIPVRNEESPSHFIPCDNPISSDSIEINHIKIE